jgi:hypothetical protein
MPQGNPYVDQTNADVAQFLGQQNLSNQQNRGGSFAGGGESINDIMIGGKFQHGLGQQAADADVARHEKVAQADVGRMDFAQRRAADRAMEAKKQEFELSKQAMEYTASQQKELLLQNKLLSLKLSNSEAEASLPIEQKIKENKDALFNLSTSMSKAAAEHSRGSKESEIAFENHRKDLAAHADAKNAFLAGFDDQNYTKSADGKRVVKTVDQNLLGSTKATSLSNATAQVLNQYFSDPNKLAPRTGIATLGTSIGTFFEGLGELGTGGNKTYDEKIKGEFSPGLGREQEISGDKEKVFSAARLWNKGSLNQQLKETMTSGLFTPDITDDETARKNANLFSNDLLTEIFTTNVKNSGISVKEDAKQSMQTLLAKLRDVSSRDYKTSDDMDKLQQEMKPFIENVAVNVFGDPNNAPEVVEIIEHTLKQAAQDGRNLSQDVLGAGGNIDDNSVRKAGMSHALTLAGNLANNFHAATLGQYMTRDQLSLLTGSEKQASEMAGSPILGAEGEVLGTDKGSAQFMPLLADKKFVKLLSSTKNGSNILKMMEEQVNKGKAFQEQRAGATREKLQYNKNISDADTNRVPAIQKANTDNMTTIQKELEDLVASRSKSKTKDQETYQ